MQLAEANTEDSLSEKGGSNGKSDTEDDKSDTEDDDVSKGDGPFHRMHFVGDGKCFEGGGLKGKSLSLINGEESDEEQENEGNKSQRHEHAEKNDGRDGDEQIQGQLKIPPEAMVSENKEKRDTSTKTQSILLTKEQATVSEDATQSSQNLVHLSNLLMKNMTNKNEEGPSFRLNADDSLEVYQIIREHATVDMNEGVNDETLEALEKGDLSELSIAGAFEGEMFDDGNGLNKGLNDLLWKDNDDWFKNDSV